MTNQQKIMVFVGIALLLLWRRDSDEPSTPAPVDDGEGGDSEVDMSANDPLIGASYGTLRAAAIQAANDAGATPDLFLAIISAESGWRTDAYNGTGGDAARGGAYGLGQVTLATARAIDDQRPTEWRNVDPSRSGASLRANPSLSLLLAAQVLAQAEQFAARDPGDVERNAASRYNSWRPYANAPVSTRTYVDRVMRFLAQERSVIAGDTRR